MSRCEYDKVSSSVLSKLNSFSAWTEVGFPTALETVNTHRELSRSSKLEFGIYTPQGTNLGALLRRLIYPGMLFRYWEKEASLCRTAQRQELKSTSLNHLLEVLFFLFQL